MTTGDNLQQKRRAWELAHKLLSIVEIIPKRERKALLVVGTEEICKAMGTPQKAKLEAVQQFVFDVISFMRGHGVFIACGCGYLSLMVCADEGHEETVANRETTAFLPESLDEYFEKHVLGSGAEAGEAVLEICDKDKNA